MRSEEWRLAGSDPGSGYVPASVATPGSGTSSGCVGPSLARRAIHASAAGLMIALLTACGGSGNEPSRQPFSRQGVGNQVFDMPSDVDRVRITASFSGDSSNFIVWVSNELIVNELLGTTWGPLTYSGTHQIRGGTTRIEDSTGVSWTITEIQ